ncbi:hypothetical protein FHS18_004777 [Paenibacillus phyllosphaerae]|uniref:Uncharacterized protein n=1 Tax=Paenibacillus phyllosphaerae TaxID=274593 RepID=A0A7W5FPR7_9BACL|nr:transposase [Paenibacillus phyllosphaerae]MBB3112676.1 hypothetical protein [Paenibacillus phyllosphaerae]
MSDKKRHFEMQPMSGEHVEVEGVYKDEWGREQKLQRGDTFPPNAMLGTTEWELVELDFGNHHEGKTDSRLVPKSDDQGSKNANLSGPRTHLDSGDK